MSVFSDLLSEYITMKDVGVYPLSQFCGLDRSFMYKIINGKRNPSGEDVVRKMAQFMQLTPREKTDFMDAFYITQMGEEVYYRRKSVGELIETFSRREGRKEHIFYEKELAKMEMSGGERRDSLSGRSACAACNFTVVFRRSCKRKRKNFRSGSAGLRFCHGTSAGSRRKEPEFDDSPSVLYEQQREANFNAEKLQPELSAENSTDLCLWMRLPCAVLLRQCGGAAE